MIIAVSASTPDLDGDVDPRFGRCRYLIVINTETMAFEAVDNSSSMSAGGAGISAVQQISNKGVQALLTGNCGPNAYQALSAAETKVITGVSGKIKQAVQMYKSGDLQAASSANVTEHFGIGKGTVSEK